MDEKGAALKKRLDGVFEPFGTARYLVARERENKPANEDRLRGIVR